MKRIHSHRELDVYRMSFDASMRLFELSKAFPREEQYSLTDQVRRSSRSVSANISEAFRKRKYPKSFVSKLSDAEAEAAETQTWLDFAFKCKYIDPEPYKMLNREYDFIIGKLVNMARFPEKWVV
ncbi:four helix bundle protein [Rhodohalobacter sp. SW132]|uniref:four helix bundle protein n=1 Tax=Rhodohalobacter sp. SW132 TaxID=2293433 RepID=UPI000E23AE17|nr:four helix bundle protein [Rhodohalobacter sp. SW132]REL37535.1 four helix bundle protein [Rhodohalobacter sp. SW132]